MNGAPHVQPPGQGHHRVAVAAPAQVRLDADAGHDLAHLVERAVTQLGVRPEDDPLPPAALSPGTLHHLGPPHREVEEVLAVDLRQGHRVDRGVDVAHGGGRGLSRVVPAREREDQRRLVQDGFHVHAKRIGHPGRVARSRTVPTRVRAGFNARIGSRVPARTRCGAVETDPVRYSDAGARRSCRPRASGCRAAGPTPLQQLAARDGLAFVRDQRAQQTHLARGEGEGAPGRLDLEAIEEDGHVAEAELPGRPVATAVPASPAQQALHPRQQLVELEGLREVVVGALLDPPHHVARVVLCGEDQDRHVVPRRAGAPSDLEPAHLRQHQVEDHQVERPVRIRELRDGLAAVVGDHDLVALGLEVEAEPVGDVGVVLHHEDACLGRHGLRRVVMGSGAPGPRAG